MSGESQRSRAQRGHRGASGARASGPRHSGGPSPSRYDETGRQLTRLLAPVVSEAGYDLEEIKVEPAGRRRLVRVVVDADGGVSLDDVSVVSRAVSSVLDETDVMGSAPYVLEVTSPGVDRPLTESRHWRRAVGHLVRVPLTAGGEIEGRVVTVEDEAVVIDVAPAPRGPGKSHVGAPEPTRRRLGLDELGRGRVQVEFRRGDAGDPEGDED
jgi:ribosome maturation factor RimP